MANQISALTFGIKDFPPLPLSPSQLIPLPRPFRKAFKNTKKKKLRCAISRPASPSLRSPTVSSSHPDRNLQQLKFDTMHKSSFPPDRTGKGNSRASPQLAPHPRRPQEAHRNNLGHKQSPLPGKGSSLIPSTVIFPSTSNSNARTVPGSQAQTSSMPRNTKDFQDHVDTLLNKVYRDAEMSNDTKTEFESRLKALVHDHNEQSRRLQDSLDRATRERDQSVSEVKMVRADLDLARAERDVALREVSQQRSIIAELHAAAAKESQTLARMQSSWKETHDSMRQQLSFQDEQLKGKRALWLESNPNSSARRNAMTAIGDPFSSPTVRTGLDKSHLGNLGSPIPASPLTRSSFNQIQEYKAPPPFSNPKSSPGQLGDSFQSLVIHPSSNRGLRKRGNLPMMRGPVPILDMGIYGGSQQSLYKTEPGSLAGRDDPPPFQPSIRADMATWSDDTIAEYYQDEFAKLFAMTEGWVKSYCSQPNMANDRKIAETSQELWQYMLNCAYPGQMQDSQNHVMALLNDARSRCWFIMRMIIAFCVKEVLAIDVYASYGAKTEADLNRVKLKLLERGLATEARQKLIDEQARIIQGILQNPDDCAPWRNRVLNNISKRLRDMVGGVLNDGADRGRAGSDLGAIGMYAWKLSNDIHTSHLTFQIFFPETAAKFNASTMVSKEPTRLTALELQIKQMRLKLIITPVVTLRDDRTTTIKAKSLHHATVLTMN